MKIGVSFPTTEVGNDPIVMRDFAQAAEDMGYEYLTAIDHVLQARDPAGDDFQRVLHDRQRLSRAADFIQLFGGGDVKICFVTAILDASATTNGSGLQNKPPSWTSCRAGVCDSAAGSAGTTSSSMRWIRTSKNRARRISDNLT